MVAIPKISLSSGRKREKCNLDFDCSTTSNFGYVQPTMAREMIPNSKFSVKVSSLVRLGEMPLPTFGRSYLKHTHVFVPYVDVCPQFDSLIAGQPYRISGNAPNGMTQLFYPEQLTPYLPSVHAQEVLACFADWTIYKPDSTTTAAYSPILLDDTGTSSLTDLKTAWDYIFHTTQNHYQYGKLCSGSTIKDTLPNSVITPRPRNYHSENSGCLRLGSWYMIMDNTKTSTDSTFDYITAANPNNSITPSTDPYYVTLDSADYISLFGPVANPYLIAFKLKPVGKRIRTIIQGLGYQFTPNLAFPSINPNATFNDPNKSNWLKLLAFYKAWFSVYRPKRDLSFNSTHCYELIKACEVGQANQIYNHTSYVLHSKAVAYNFIFDLGMDCYGYLPQDYFGMSVVTPNANYMGQVSNNGISVLSSGSNSVAPVILPNTSSPSDDVNIKAQNLTPSVSFGSSNPNPAAVAMALKILKYVNKNTIVGRSIHDYIKAHFGVSIDESHDLDSVYVIGSSSVNIQISDVMSNASTQERNLGAYAGKGIGFGDSETFTYENNKNFGVWITLSVVMPKSGYYQGILKENQALTKYDFFTPEFDALGYQTLAHSELTADYPVCNVLWRPCDATTGVNPANSFGFVPRYSHLKVGRNIVNGDLSLRGIRNDMAPYTLDRMIPYESYSNATNSSGGSGQWVITKPRFIPNVVFDEFRRIDPSDTLGNYNRIFYYQDNDLDHFIIHNIFSVDAWLPAKSLSESFDTYSDDDSKVIEIEHS